MGSTATYTVTGMRCGGCAASLREGIGALDGVSGIEVDVPAGTVTVSSDQPIDPERVRAAVEEAGYQVQAG